MAAVRKDLVHHDQQDIHFRSGRGARMLKVVRIPNVRKFGINHKSAARTLDRPVAQRPEPRIGRRNGYSQVGGERVGLSGRLCHAGALPPRGAAG